MEDQGFQQKGQTPSISSRGSSDQAHHIAVRYPRGKWTPTYEGPFVTKSIFSGGAMILTTMDGDDLPHLVNSNIVKRYYA